jgi:hypothetical protein
LLVRIDTTVHDHQLHLPIADNGMGSAEPAHGSALVEITDWVEALGGTTKINSQVGHGTCLHVELGGDRVVPQGLRQGRHRDRTAGIQRQPDQQRPEPGAPDRGRPTVSRHLQRSEDPTRMRPLSHLPNRVVPSAGSGLGGYVDALWPMTATRGRSRRRS